MGKKVGYAIIIAFAIMVLAVVLYGLGWYVPIQQPPSGPEEGPEPVVYYKTTVYITNPWIGGAYIDRMTTEYLGQSAVYSYGEPVLMIWPFKGKVVLEVTYPGGKAVVGEQKISVDKGCTIEVNFVWKTTYSGKHTVIASLYDENNVLIDQKSESVMVPTR